MKPVPPDRPDSRKDAAPLTEATAVFEGVAPYRPRRAPQHLSLAVRELEVAIRWWPASGSSVSDAGPTAAPPYPLRLPAEGPVLVLLHGWMDCSATFQFLVDDLPAHWPCLAPDWRGYGGTRAAGPVDTYWFANYLADLDGLLQQLVPDRPVVLVGHSMGGNVAMIYAGVRPDRVSAVVNLEGFGLPESAPDQAPQRLRRFLDGLQEPVRLPEFADQTALAARLLRNNAYLTPDRALYLAGEWGAPAVAEGTNASPGHESHRAPWHLRADPAHRRPGGVPYRLDEVLACWRAMTAPVLWLQSTSRTGSLSHTHQPDYALRLRALRDVRVHDLPDCGHMLHHERSARVAELMQDFLAAPEKDPP